MRPLVNLASGSIPEILKGAAPLPGLDKIEVIFVQPAASTFLERVAEGLLTVHVLGDALVTIIAFAVGLMFGAAGANKVEVVPPTKPAVIIMTDASESLPPATAELRSVDRFSTPLRDLPGAKSANAASGR